MFRIYLDQNALGYIFTDSFHMDILVERDPRSIYMLRCVRALRRLRLCIRCSPVHGNALSIQRWFTGAENEHGQTATRSMKTLTSISINVTWSWRSYLCKMHFGRCALTIISIEMGPGAHMCIARCIHLTVVTIHFEIYWITVTSVYIDLLIN